MPRTDKLSTYRTTWEQEGPRGSVTYAHTRIVHWGRDYVSLNSGGWQTVTTKRKMNQAANQFGLGFGVTQQDGEWYVCRRVYGQEEPTWRWMAYADGITFPKGPLTGYNAHLWGHESIKAARKAAE